MEIIGRQFDIDRPQIFLESVQLCGSRDRHDPGLACQQPGQGDLSRCCLLPGRDLTKKFDAGLIGLPHLGRKAGRNAAHIRFVELRVRTDGAGEEPLTERSERNKADAELLEGGQDFLLRLPPPKRILALQGRHGLHSVRPSDGSNACLRQPKMPDLALLDQILDGSRHVLDRHRGIDAMLIE